MTATEGHPIVRLERTIAAPPHQVYRAWLEPDVVQRWMGPGARAARVEVEERVGGHYRIWHTDSGTDVGGFDAELLELVPDQRIVWRWGFVGPNRHEGPTYDSRLTVTLLDAPGGATALTLVHEQLDSLAAAMPAVADAVGPGWNDVLDQLDAMLGSNDAQLEPGRDDGHESNPASWGNGQPTPDTRRT